LYLTVPDTLPAGDYSFDIVSDLTDPNEGLIMFLHDPLDLTASTMINVHAAAVPEPPIIILMGLSAFGFFFRRRKPDIKKS
jgi:hypothetical protein